MKKTLRIAVATLALTAGTLHVPNLNAVAFEHTGSTVVTNQWRKRTIEEVQTSVNESVATGGQHYIVQWGDTLGTISNATGFSVADLALINQISNPDLIMAGSSLYFDAVNQTLTYTEPSGEEVEVSVADEVVVEIPEATEAGYLIAPVDEWEIAETVEEPVVEETELVEEPVVEETELVEEPAVEETELVEEPAVEETELVEEPVVEEAELVEEPFVEDVETIEVVETPTLTEEEILAAEQAAADQAAADQAAADQAAADQAAADQAAADQAAADQAAADQAAADQAAADQAAADQAAADQAAADQAAADQAAADQAAADQAAADQAAADQAAADQAAADQAAADQAAADQAAAEEATATDPSGYGTAITVEATAYSRNQPELGNFTADGTDLRNETAVIAVDPSVIPLGSLVYIPGFGTYRAADTGGAIVGNKIDIHMESIDSVYQFGRQSMTVYIVE